MNSPAVLHFISFGLIAWIQTIIVILKDNRCPPIWAKYYLIWISFSRGMSMGHGAGSTIGRPRCLRSIPMPRDLRSVILEGRFAWGRKDRGQINPEVRSRRPEVGETQRTVKPEIRCQISEVSERRTEIRGQRSEDDEIQRTDDGKIITKARKRE